MYSLEDRMKAVELYFKYGGRSAAVRRELGYPTKNALKHWIREFKATGSLRERRRPSPPRHSDEQKQAAVDHYLEHGRCMQRTLRALGYPHKSTLKAWLDEALPERRGLHSTGLPRTKVELTLEQKQAAVVDLESRDGPAREVSDKYGVSRTALYQWRYRLLGKERSVSRQKRGEPASDQDELLAKVKALKQQVESLEQHVHRLQLERDVLEVTADILKKDPGADPKQLTNREKATAIGALRTRYPLDRLLACFAVAKSSYFYQRTALSVPDKYVGLRERVSSAFAAANGRYGYRRIHACLARDGKTVSEKVVRRLMRDADLVVIGLKKRRYSSYLGEISPPVPNVLNRDFHADLPNTKWLTDLTEFPLPAGKVYLSPVIDCFDGMAVSWSIGTSPDAKMANAMLDNAIATLRQDERPVVHSDRGSHYRWPGWIGRMEAARLRSADIDLDSDETGGCLHLRGS